MLAVEKPSLEYIYSTLCSTDIIDMLQNQVFNIIKLVLYSITPYTMTADTGLDYWIASYR